MSDRENLETQEELLEKRHEDKINNLQNSLKKFYTEELQVRTALFARIMWSAGFIKGPQIDLPPLSPSSGARPGDRSFVRRPGKKEGGRPGSCVGTGRRRGGTAPLSAPPDPGGPQQAAGRPGAVPRRTDCQNAG